MATRSAIIHVIDDNTARGIYCHFDGYPQHHGPILRDHYNTPEKVAALMDLGDLSSLGELIAPPEGVPHSYQKPADGVCVAYGRDRGEQDTEALRGHPLDVRFDLKSRDVDCTYTFRDGKWRYGRGNTERSIQNAIDGFTDEERPNV